MVSFDEGMGEVGIIGHFATLHMPVGALGPPAVPSRRKPRAASLDCYGFSSGLR